MPWTATPALASPTCKMLAAETAALKLTIQFAITIHQVGHLTVVEERQEEETDIEL